MSRRITQRLRVKGLLTAESPLHVGGLEGDVNVDLALAINGQGRYYIPGTSVAGALRSWMQQMFEEQILDRIWGFQRGDDGIASFVMVEDAIVTPSAPIEIREGVGIDRRWGTAADRAKYNRAILPKGTTFPLALTLEIENSTFTGVQDAIEALLDALCASQIRLGAAKTRGLGKVKLSEVKIVNETLAGKSNLLQVLKGEINPQPYAPKPPKISPHITIAVDWSPVDAVMVKAEQDGMTVDILPFVSSVDQLIALTIPGSSIKGSLRFQAERIIRTVKSQALKDEFLEQVEIPIVNELFGSAARSKKDHSRRPINLGLGALTLDDCYSKIQLHPQQWENITSAEDSATLVEALQPLAQTQQAFHVAVDRWTGGAADTMLYSNLEPFGVAWEPIHLTVQLNRLLVPSVAIALLLLTLRDLMTGRIPLGYGANRGLGAIQVHQVKLQGYSLSEPLQSLNREASLTVQSDGRIQGLDDALLLYLNQQWQTWIDASTEDAA